MFILCFDCCSIAGIDIVYRTGFKFVMRLLAYYDESAIWGYFESLYHKSFVYKLKMENN